MSRVRRFIAGKQFLRSDDYKPDLREQSQKSAVYMTAEKNDLIQEQSNQ